MSDAVFEEVRAHFSEAEMVDLTLAVVAINGWNRIAIGFTAASGAGKDRSGVSRA